MRNSGNQLVIVGNLTADPEVRFTPSGKAVMHFTVASTPRRFDQASEDWTDGETTFMDVTAWRQLAENAGDSLLKGSRVIVAGSVRTERWLDKESGDKRSRIVLDADDIGASLMYATVEIRRTTTRSKSPEPEIGRAHV